MKNSLDIGPAFLDPVFQSQVAFRTVMSAMAEPGTVSSLQAFSGPPRRMGCAMAAVVLTLCDFETPVWLDEELRNGTDVGDYIRFHTGAKIVGNSSEAAFALVARPVTMPPMSSFSLGTPEFPDRSTTVLIEVDALETGRGWQLTGPGIGCDTRLSAMPLGSEFSGGMRANGKLFPRGIDLILCCGESLTALPRSVRFVGEN
jgi:alpha-D-ribose 1-methylphosphonate 5-triphosphate synthase subunit PhnH